MFKMFNPTNFDVDVSIEQVAALSSQNALPEPLLNLEALLPSKSAFTAPALGYRQNSGPPARSPAPAYSSEDPWNSARYQAGPSTSAGADGFGGSAPNGAPSSLSGTGMPKDWWKKQETIGVSLLGQQGFILNRYTVYQLTTDVGQQFYRLTGAHRLIAERCHSNSAVFRICLYVGLLVSTLSISPLSLSSTKEDWT